MTAAVETDDTATPPADMPEGAKPVRVPVMVVEGMETSDRRYIEPGALDTRALPITLYAQTRSTHGADGDAATWVVGAITEAERVPGPQVIQKSTEQPFPEGTYVWVGRGWMYPDVPAAPLKSAYDMLRDGALSGNSVDLSGVEAEFEFADDAEPGDPPQRIVTYKASIAATTLVGQPAFPDAYAEVDGATELTEEQQAMVAAGRDAFPVAPAWLSADLGDTCWTCQATLTAAAMQDVVTDDREAGLVAAQNAIAVTEGPPEGYAELADGEDLDADDMPGAEPERRTDGMIALVPSNPNMLRVPGGDPAEQLHLTLAYLGDEVDQWEPEQVAAIHRLAREAVDWNFQHAMRVAEAEANGEDPPRPESYRSPAQRGPLTGNVFSHAVFNPNGDNGFKPATVYLLDGTADRQDIEWLAVDMQNAARNAIGSALFPRQHTPYVPHVTAGYGVPVSQLTYTGPVEFDRLRVAIGDDVIDYKLGGGESVLVASAATLPPIEWFQNPQLTEPTPLTVTDEGRVYGHLATWGTCHIGFSGQCVEPPRSATDYAYYLVHNTRVRDADGNAITIPVGYGTIGTGHASIRDSASMAAAHYDNTGTAAFELNAGEDEHGIWVAGRLMPGLDEATEHKARGTVFSGDWRTIRGNLELVAALGVNTPGFPVPHTKARVAGGAPLALVAAGIITAPGGAEGGPHSGTQVLGVNSEEFASVVAWVNAQRLTEEQARAALGLTEALGDGCTLSELQEADLVWALDADHPWYAEDIELAPDEDTDDQFAGVVTAAGRKVLHLPKYIKRIEKHLEKKGMSKSRAIATAVNAAKKMCATGDLNFPGSQQVNPGSRAEACAAVAQWKKDRPGAR